MKTNTHNTDVKIAVIADDLTGANDTGVQFAKQGLKTIVLMGANGPLGEIEEHVVVMDSESRSLTPREAYRKVAHAAAICQESRFHVVFKKIDSTLRGNIGREIDAIMDTCRQELAVVVPAFPKNGRMTMGGYLFLQGAPLEATEIARDPKCPVTESHIPTLLSGQTARKVGYIGIKSILAGPETILEAMRERMAVDERVLVCDAWRDEHLKIVATAAVRLEKPVLWVGSAGLAEYLPSVLGLHVVPANRLSQGKRGAGEAPVLILAGSVSAITRAQVRNLKKRSGIVSIEVDPCKLLREDSATQEGEHCLNAALNALKTGKDVVIASGYSDEVVERTRKEAASLHLSMQQTAEMIAGAMGELCWRIAPKVELGGLVLTGGDIALSCCRLLSATGLNVIEEVAPGIPLGLLKGGLCDGLRVVTKAGAFGAEDALCRALDCLKDC